MVKLFMAIGALLVVSAPAFAQANIVRYDMQVFAPGVNTVTGSPVQTNTYLVAAVTCGQPKVVVPAGGVVNPTRFAFDDPADATKDCIGLLAAGLLPALPNGIGYRTTLTQTDNLGQTSPRSAASTPFDRQGPPVVLTGVRVAP